MLDRRQAVATGLTMLLGLQARTVQAAAVWRCVTEYPATAMPGEGVSTFATAVGRLSDNALTVQPMFDGIRSATMIRAVSEGQFEAADAFTGALAGVSPLFQLSSLPFLTGSTADTTRLLSAARPDYVAALGAHGLTLLYATPWPATGIWSRGPLANAAALAGLRIRTYDAASTAVFQAAGAVPTQVSFADALPRLRAGELDAVLSSGDGGAGARLWEILPHFTAIDYASPLSLAFCRAAALDALPGPLHQAVRQAAEITEARQFAAMPTRSADNEGRMRANGVAIAASPELRDVLIKAAGPVVTEWQARAGSAGNGVLASYRG